MGKSEETIAARFYAQMLKLFDSSSAIHHSKKMYSDLGGFGTRGRMPAACVDINENTNRRAAWENLVHELHGLTHVHHFYRVRSLAVLAVIHEEVEKSRIEIRHVWSGGTVCIPGGPLEIDTSRNTSTGMLAFSPLYVPPVRFNLIEAFDRTALRSSTSGRTISTVRPLSLASRAPRLSSKFLTIASITASPIRHSDPISTIQI